MPGALALGPMHLRLRWRRTSGLAQTEVTRHPTAKWLAREITEAFPWDKAPKNLFATMTEHLTSRSRLACERWVPGTDPLVAIRFLRGNSAAARLDIGGSRHTPKWPDSRFNP
jgi:hypothetical protein